MNEVFLIGKITSEIKFDFMVKSKNKAMARFMITTIDKQSISIRAYDKMADFAYSRFQKENLVFIYGKLHGDSVEGYNITYFPFDNYFIKISEQNTDNKRKLWYNQPVKNNPKGEKNHDITK